MAGERVRWRNVREFLDDLPRTHCTTKPPHEFCTVCMRINFYIANDCPLYHQRPKRKLRPLVDRDEEDEPVKDHLSAEDVRHALEGEDFPIIEFAGPRGGAGRDAGDEEIFDVKPIEVTPLAETPPKVAMKARVPMAPKTGGRETPMTGKPDPERVVQEIMEELEFPTEEPDDETPEPKQGDEGEEKGRKGEGDVVDEGEDGGDGDEGQEPPGEPEKEPPKVSKKAVVKRKPKTRDD